MLALNEEDILQLGDDVVIHAIPELGKYWVFNVENGDQYSLTESAYFVLDLCREPIKLEVIVIKMAEEYDTQYETIKIDCFEIVHQYVLENILQRR